MMILEDDPAKLEERVSEAKENVFRKITELETELPVYSYSNVGEVAALKSAQSKLAKIHALAFAGKKLLLTEDEYELIRNYEKIKNSR